MCIFAKKNISMKKTILILLLAVLSVHSYSQKGDLTVGAKGGYAYSPNYYKGVLYGIDVAYHISYPLEIAFTGLLNPSISYEDINNDKKKLAVYSTNMDFRLYLIHQREWATGPALGGQYYIINVKDAKDNDLVTYKALGFNIGWHLRIDLTDNIKINGGWRYTNAKDKDKTKWWSSDSSFDISHHLFYLGIAYTFELR